MFICKSKLTDAHTYTHTYMQVKNHISVAPVSDCVSILRKIIASDGDDLQCPDLEISLK
jgi:hypothetical protein